MTGTARPLPDPPPAPPPQGRRERKKEETKRRIFEAALVLFSEQGFDATTIDEITQRADVAKGTFFNYFPRKESVIEFLADEWMDAAEATAAKGGSALARLRALYAMLAAAFEKHPDLSRTVMRSSAQRLCGPAGEGSWRRSEELVIAVIAQGQQAGEIRTDVDPHLMHGALASCFVGAVMWWLGERAAGGNPHAKLTLPQVVEGLQGVAMDGMKIRGSAR